MGPLALGIAALRGTPRGTPGTHLLPQGWGPGVPMLGLAWDQGMVHLPRKSRGQDTSCPLSPYMEQWREHLYAQWRLNHRDFTRLFLGGCDAIRSLLRDVLRGTLAAGLACHPFKCCGASAFMRMRGTLRSVASWAQWHSQWQARHYAAAPPAWVWPQQLHLPVPNRLGASRAYTWQLICVKDLWSRDAFKSNPCPNKPPPPHLTIQRPPPPPPRAGAL